jgi:hypothetical protein
MGGIIVLTFVIPGILDLIHIGFSPTLLVAVRLCYSLSCPTSNLPLHSCVCVLIDSIPFFLSLFLSLSH